MKFLKGFYDLLSLTNFFYLILILCCGYAYQCRKLDMGIKLDVERCEFYRNFISEIAKTGLILFAIYFLFQTIFCLARWFEYLFCCYKKNTEIGIKTTMSCCLCRKSKTD